MTPAARELIAVLQQAQENEVPVTIITVGGYRLHGHVLDADSYAATVELRDEGGNLCTVVVDQIAVGPVLDFVAERIAPVVENLAALDVASHAP